MSQSSGVGLLDELEQLLMGIALMKELTSRTKDYLVSFGERLSTRLFAAYLNSIGTYARQVRKFLCLSGPITGCDYSACG